MRCHKKLFAMWSCELQGIAVRYARWLNCNTSPTHQRGYLAGASGWYAAESRMVI
jgi:hypothetical protein